MAKRTIDGLTLKIGPTQSGALPTPTAIPVGGELADINVVSVFLTQYWPLIILMVIPLALGLYAKRNAFPKWILRLMYRIKDI